jgi:hypothetical protein
MFTFLRSLFIFFIYLSSISCYSLEQLTNGVWLSGAAYCGKDKYPTMKLAGPVSDFVYDSTIYDPKTDLQGFIGKFDSTKSIHVVLRGSSSKMNWLDDFEINKVTYESFPECNCKVHNGFYKSARNVVNSTINSVNLLLKFNPGYDVYVNGHSYGGSSGHLLAMELVKYGIKPHVYDYGQPRPGDKTFATFSKNKLQNYWRTTHNKDMVPHVPPIEGFGYYHSCGEIFEDNNGALHTCSSTVCEDPKCADQYALYQTNTDDHYYYLGHRVSCENSTII